MAEKIVSPGVFTNEIDQSFLPAAVAEIGAAIVGPTVKGPHLVPTVVTSYSEYVQNFGDTFTSGSSTQAYLTSVAAKEYLKSADKLTVIRILDGSPTSARAFVTTGSMDSVTDHTGFTSSNKTGMFREGIPNLSVMGSFNKFLQSDVRNFGQRLSNVMAQAHSEVGE